MSIDLTKGNILHNLAAFAAPYLLACFLQTFYAVADLFIAGLYNGSSTISAIAIGGQVLHLVILLIAGLAMGVNVGVGRAFGEKNYEKLRLVGGNALTLFLLIGVGLELLFYSAVTPIVEWLQTPVEAFEETIEYTRLCFLGIPLIALYNAFAAIYRGLGDTRRPLIFVAVGGLVNIGLDFVLIGLLGMGARGAAIATLCGMFISVLLAFVCGRVLPQNARFTKHTLRLQENTVTSIFAVGAPIAVQDLFIQIGFLVITAIANTRGLSVSAAVGIVEKLICFFFLVPSAMLASVSAACAQNRGAGLHERSKTVLRYAIRLCLGYGILIGLLCQPMGPALVGLFTNDKEVIRLGAQYLSTYSFDTAVAGVHFCFSGFFCAYDKAIWSFIHNFCSVSFRIPGTWVASVLFPMTLYEMGCVAPIGSVISIVICLFVYRHYRNTAFCGANEAVSAN